MAKKGVGGQWQCPLKTLGERTGGRGKAQLRVELRREEKERRRRNRKRHVRWEKLPEGREKCRRLWEGLQGSSAGVQRDWEEQTTTQQFGRGRQDFDENVGNRSEIASGGGGGIPGGVACFD